MAKEMTISDLHNDVEKARRINSLGNAMIASKIGRVEKNIVGSTTLLCAELRATSLQNHYDFENLESSLEGLRSDVYSYSNGIHQAISDTGTKIASAFSQAMNKAQMYLSKEIQIATAKLQLSIEGVESVLANVNEQLELLLKENKLQTSLLNEINEGVHSPEIQEINNGIEDFMLEDYLSAEQSFKRALNHRLSLYLAHYYLGLIYLEEKGKKSLFDIDKAEEEISDAISYGEKRMESDGGTRTYMILAHKYLATIFYKKGEFDQALEELNKGIKISEDIEDTKIKYVEQFIHCYNAKGETDKALEFVRFGLDKDSTYVSLLCDDEIENLQQDILTIIEEKSASFADTIAILTSGIKDMDLLIKINESVSSDDAKTFLGRKKILSMIREGK